MAISRETVLHVAGLARLHLTEAEVTQLMGDLGKILAHIDQLGELDTTHVPATDFVVVESLAFRDDEPVCGLSNDQALTPAPSHLNGGFRVPVFVED